MTAPIGPKPKMTPGVHNRGRVTAADNTRVNPAPKTHKVSTGMMPEAVDMVMNTHGRARAAAATGDTTKLNSIASERHGSMRHPTRGQASAAIARDSLRGENIARSIYAPKSKKKLK